MTAFSAAAHDEGGDTTKALRARITDLEDMLAAVGAGGVGPLMPITVQHQGKSSGDNELQRKTGDLITTAAPPQTDGIPPNWQLVPMEPTIRQMAAMGPAIRACYDMDGVSGNVIDVYRAMLAAAPKPPTTEQSSVVEQPDPAYLLRDLAADIGVEALDLIAAIRDVGLGSYSINMMLPARVCVAMCQRFSAVGQAPVAWIENVEGAIGYNPYHEAARKLPDGVRFDLYAHPQNLRCKSNQARLATLWGYVKAEPLTDEQIAAATGAKPGTPMWLVAVALTRAIGGAA